MLIPLPEAVYLEAAEADHAVHHLCDTETMAEVVEGVVLVVVMNTQLQRDRERRLLTLNPNSSSHTLTLWVWVSPAIS